MATLEQQQKDIEELLLKYRNLDRCLEDMIVLNQSMYDNHPKKPAEVRKIVSDFLGNITGLKGNFSSLNEIGGNSEAAVTAMRYAVEDLKKALRQKIELYKKEKQEKYKEIINKFKGLFDFKDLRVAGKSLLKAGEFLKKLPEKERIEARDSFQMIDGDIRAVVEQGVYELTGLNEIIKGSMIDAISSLQKAHDACRKIKKLKENLEKKGEYLLEAGKILQELSNNDPLAAKYLIHMLKKQKIINKSIDGRVVDVISSLKEAYNALDKIKKLKGNPKKEGEYLLEAGMILQDLSNNNPLAAKYLIHMLKKQKIIQKVPEELDKLLNFLITIKLKDDAIKELDEGSQADGITKLKLERSHVINQILYDKTGLESSDDFEKVVGKIGPYLKTQLSEITDQMNPSLEANKQNLREKIKQIKEKKSRWKPWEKFREFFRSNKQPTLITLHKALLKADKNGLIQLDKDKEDKIVDQYASSELRWERKKNESEQPQDREKFNSLIKKLNQEMPDLGLQHEKGKVTVRQGHAKRNWWSSRSSKRLK